MFMVSTVLLFEIAPHHGDELSRGASLFRFRLSVRIDDVKTNMAFEDLGHQAVERAAGSRDELQYLSAILFLVDGFFDSINLPLEPSHPVYELLLASNGMSHERKYNIPGRVSAIGLWRLFCEILVSDYSRSASNASHNSRPFARDRAHAGNEYDLRDAFEQRYAIMKSPDEKSYALRLASRTEIARRVFTLWWAERARFYLLMGRCSHSRRLRRLNFWNSRRWRDEMTSRTEPRRRYLRDFGPLAAFIHGEQLGDSHKFESFCEKRIKNLGHRRNRRRVDVM
jgi:hypothetical protein